jgi:hypothetical protein
MPFMLTYISWSVLAVNVEKSKSSLSLDIADPAADYVSVYHIFIFLAFGIFSSLAREWLGHKRCEHEARKDAEGLRRIGEAVNLIIEMLVNTKSSTDLLRKALDG